MRAISPKVKNSLRFDTDVPVVPWRLLGKFVLLIGSCTYRSSVVGSIQEVIDLVVEVEDVQVDMIMLISPYHREICISGIHIISLIK